MARTMTEFKYEVELSPMPTEETPPTQFVSETGARRNSIGKTPYAYLPLDLLDGAAWVMQLGATKYGNGNYRKGFEPLDALNSLLRHVTSLQLAVSTEDMDGSAGHLLDDGAGGSGQAHIHHVITSALILLDSMRLKGYKV